MTLGLFAAPHGRRAKARFGPGPGVINIELKNTWRNRNIV